MKISKFKIAAALLGLALSTSTPAFATGWYIMAPPSRDTTIYFQAPLSAWITTGSFDSAGACNHQLEWNQEFNNARTDQELRQILEQARIPLPASVLRQAMDAGKCIASDDPRLR